MLLGLITGRSPIQGYSRAGKQVHDGHGERAIATAAAFGSERSMSSSRVDRHDRIRAAAVCAGLEGCVRALGPAKLIRACAEIAVEIGAVQRRALALDSVEPVPDRLTESYDRLLLAPKRC